MAGRETRDFQDAYLAEQQNISLRYGRAAAVALAIILGYMFVNDYVVMDVGALAFTRMVGFIPSVIYLLLSWRYLRRHKEHAIMAQAGLLTSAMISCALFAVGLFRLGPEGAAYGAAGTMQAGVLAMFVFGNGVRKYLWAIIGIPLVLTLVAIGTLCAPTRLELTLFYTPFIAAICVVAAAASQARMAARSFRMGRLVEQHKEELEDKAEALQLANNELQQFAGAVAHDLKVPLHSMRTAMDEALQECRAHEVPGQVCEQIEVMRETADRLSQMIASMLNYAALENCSEEFADVPLQDVGDAVRQTIQGSIEASGAEIASEPLPVVWGDRVQLTMLLQELLINAIKYAKPGQKPSIRITSEALPGAVRIRVSDRGIGFDSRHKRAVFRPYEQLRTHATRNGTGIGLASCAKIVKLHDGTIGVDPVENEGCTFIFTLPTQPSAPTRR